MTRARNRAPKKPHKHKDLTSWFPGPIQGGYQKPWFDVVCCVPKEVPTRLPGAATKGHRHKPVGAARAGAQRGVVADHLWGTPELPKARLIKGYALNHVKNSLYDLEHIL